MEISGDAIGALARGCALLGSGGGGTTRTAEVIVQFYLGQFGPVQLLDVDDLQPNALVASAGAMGSATVMLERIPSGIPFIAACTSLERRLGVRIDAIAPLQVGGINGLMAVLAAAALGRPLVDVDQMGRSFPQVEQTVFTGRIPLSPAALGGSDSSSIVIDQHDDAAAGAVLRATLLSLGGWGALVCRSASAADYSRYGVLGTLSRALDLGAALDSRGTTDGLIARPDVTLIFEGTIIEVLRRTGDSDGGGVVSVRHARDRRRVGRVEYTNEYVAVFDNGDLAGAAPDILVLVDTTTALPILTEQVALHQRVRVLRIDAPPALRDAYDAHPDPASFMGFAALSAQVDPASR